MPAMFPSGRRTQWSYTDPLVTFKAVSPKSQSSSVTSVCFLLGDQDGEGDRYNSTRTELDDQSSTTSTSRENSDDDEFASYFQTEGRPSQSITTTSTTNNNNNTASSSLSPARILTSTEGYLHDQLALHSVRLATCDFEGNALIWDIGKSQCIATLVDSPRGPGLTLRRVGNGGTFTTGSCTSGETQKTSDHLILFHTRDPLGTVSLHDVSTTRIVSHVSTYSHTFCAAAPCYGNANLVALPSGNDTQAVVRDWRVPASAAPVACLDAATGAMGSHGMLTSVAMWQGTNTNLLLCGMEDGSLFFHDWSLVGRDTANTFHKDSIPCNYISLGSDPVLTLDVSPSPGENKSGSSVCLAGLAGDASEVAKLEEPERGRIVLVKATPRRDVKGSWQGRIRSRMGTSTTGGKPGVAVSRFRPDGRIFCAGGWDHRVRIFHRDGRPLTILRGHEKGIQSIDWAPNAVSSGLLASGSSDGRVCVWRYVGSHYNEA